MPLEDSTKNNTKDAEPNAGRAVAADVVSDAVGAAAGPVAAVVGACALSIYDLYQQGAFDEGADNGKNNGSWSYPIDENPLNEYDFIGNTHNTIVSNYINNFSYLNLDSEDGLNDFKEYLLNQVETQLEIEVSDEIFNNNFSNEIYEFLGFNEFNSDYDLILENANDLELIELNSSQIISIYLNNVTNLEINAALQYSEEVENLITNSTELNAKEKEVILSAISVGKHSKALYYNFIN